MAPPRRVRRRDRYGVSDPSAGTKPYVRSLPWLGTTWEARGAPYWWRRIGASVVLLLVIAIDGAFIVAALIGIRHESLVGCRVTASVLAVAAVATAIATWVQTSPRRIEATAGRRDGSGRPPGRAAASAGVGLGALARAGSTLSSLLLFVLAVLTVGPMLVLFLRTLGSELAVERRERVKLAGK